VKNEENGDELCRSTANQFIAELRSIHFLIISMSSVSKMRVAPAGIFGGDPFGDS